MIFNGKFNTLLPPSPSTLAVWVDFADLDRRRNQGLTVGSSVAANAVKNKGYLGGSCTTPSGTGPVLRLNSTGVYTLDFGGVDKRLFLSFAAQAQPNTIAAVVRKNAAGTSMFFDGPIGARHFCFDNGFMQFGAGNFIAANSGSVLNAYNLVYCSYNGATSAMDFNAFQPLNGAYPNGATGDAGSNASTALTIGAQNDGTSPLNGEFAGFVMMWHGAAPTSQQVWDYASQILNPGFSMANLSRPAIWPYPTSARFQAHGGDKIVFMGDSITFGTVQIWFTPYVASINAGVGTPVTSVNKGIAGQVMAQMQARFAADVIAQNPQGCWIEGGTNDLFARTPYDELAASLQAMIDAWVTSGRPVTKLGIIGVMCRGEFYPDPTDVEVQAMNNLLASVAYKNGCPFANVRSPEQTFEQANNTPAPGNLHTPGPLGQGLWTADGSHPNLLGQAAWSSAAFAVTDLSG